MFSHCQEVENFATMKVQDYFDSLDEYLLTGREPAERCFEHSEAEQWRDLVTVFR